MSYDPERVTFFAKTDARGQQVPFGIKDADRARHMYVIGKTGMGKSTMLENMAVQDIQNGEGIAVIDPHGSLAEKLLEYVPENRIKDVLYFAPSDMENPISFNIMEDVGPDKRHLVVSGLMSVFEKIWVDMWSARMAYILQNTLMALLEYPDSTLLGVNRMLSDKNYRNNVVENITDPSVRSFWVDEFAKYNERYMQEAGDAIKNKIGQFTSNPMIRNIIGQPKSSFDIRDIIDNKKIFIINLSKGLMGETNANLLGSMLTTRIYLAAMSRAELPAAQMAKAPNFYFYVDEFQSFANATFANILSEARKYKLNLIIAHQYIEQMEEEVKNAVFGNVGTIISFRVGPFDAEVLETIFTPQFTATDIVNLGFAQIYLTLMIGGIGSQPFSAVTLPPMEPAQTSHQDRIIAMSRKQYSHPRAEVEVVIEKWHEPVRGPEKKRSQPEREVKREYKQEYRREEPKRNEKKSGNEGGETKEYKREYKKEGGREDGSQKNERGDSRQDDRREGRRNDNSQRDDRHNERSEQRHDQRQQRPQQRSQWEKKEREEKGIGELRSVLQSISKDVAKDKQNNVVKTAEREVEKKEEEKKIAEKEGHAKSELKDALSSVAPKAGDKKESEMTAEELEKMLRLDKHDSPPIKRS